MKYRNLGKSGIKVSVIGLGTNQFGGKVDLEGVKKILSSALDTGINFIDTADVYQGGRSEELIGKALKKRRHQAVVATKVRHKVGEGPNDKGASRQHIINGVHDSLRRLDTDYIDLYQIHAWDEDTPIEETMRALDDLQRSGKVRYIGASNFSAWQLIWSNALSELRGWRKFISIQPHYHMFEREVEKELIPACSYFGLGIIPYFPLAGGFLTGKYKRNQPAPPGSRGETSQYVQRYLTGDFFDRLEKLEQFAKERNHNLTELAHAWLLAQPMVSSVISGVTRIEHLHMNMAAAQWELTAEDNLKINEILDATEPFD